MIKRIAILGLALAPSVALAHNSPGTLRFGISETHVGMAGAAANMPGLTLGVGGQYHGVGIRAGVSYARSGGASLEALRIRATASPRATLSPYLSAGMIDLASLGGATSSAITYAVNPTTGVITPATTITDLPPRGVVMGYAFAGLRARVALNPRWALAAHAGIGAGIGGSVTGLPASSAGGGRSPFATLFGAGIRYRVTPHTVAALSYSRTAIPVRGATFRCSGVALTMARTF
ncbi:hypothetical protein C4901_07310 [Acidiferrobacter sp. SPIII_3]|uniref:hypothetical protein n=1 Tax=Acidiferrobacter sp. SPIII_3 TaxID=1281578 RepID=UPI000D73D7DD|nr:hypothetical protein [Acidiferrobacter sp. SPIII_3]AWP23158.1 hypothetical protein C4901_07310 [Acidiferrobacter sp. SPIII_3]